MVNTEYPMLIDAQFIEKQRARAEAVTKLAEVCTATSCETPLYRPNTKYFFYESFWVPNRLFPAD